MKIKFWNLGSIKEAELDLRPLTVIIGPNNSNKTYIAYSIYGLFKQINNLFQSVLFSRTIFNSKNKRDIDERIKIKDEKNSVFSLEIDDFFYELFEEQIELCSAMFSGPVLESFFQDSSRKIFEKTRFHINVSATDIKLSINNLNDQEFPDIINKFEQKENRYYLYLNENKNNSSFFENRDRNILLLALYLSSRCIFTDVLPLPAERNAFINTYKMLANRRYKLLKDRDRGLFGRRRMDIERQLELLQEQGDIRYPQPVEDFLDFLSDVELEDKPAPKPDNKNEFQKLADQIEEHIQNKNKTKFKETKFGGREIKIAVKRGLEIDLYNASSSIKQLAPLLIYLRYRAKPGDFLVIDEPEMNLHPESQVKLLEALAILVNLGVRVLLTTHSPYLMAHLNNIVSGNHQDPDILTHQAQSLYLQDAQAFLKMEQVSAYEMKNNQLISLHDPDYGIRWDTLSDVSVDVQQKFFAIYEAGQKSQETEI